MADKTAIEWAANADGSPGATWNPIRARNRATGGVGWFCTHASPGCEHCYAEAINHRLGTGVAFKAQNAGDVEIFLDERTLTQPLRWKRPRTIFVGSMTDLAGDFVSDAILHRVFAAMAMAKQHTFIVLTKRIDRLKRWLDQWAGRRFVAAIVDDDCNEVVDFPLRNVWVGTSAEDQRRADERIPDLLATPAAVRFVSLEPLLGPIELDEAWHGASGRGLDWVIVGGESGRGARPMHPDWARGLRDQCAAAGVPFFFKQWGEWTSHNFHDLPGRGGFVSPDGTLLDDVVAVHNSDCEKPCRLMFRVGKLAAGRVLDGRTHDDRPPLVGAPSCP